MCEKCDEAIAKADVVIFQLTAYIQEGDPPEHIRLSFRSDPNSWKEELKEEITVSGLEQVFEGAILALVEKKMEISMYAQLSKKIEEGLKLMEN